MPGNLESWAREAGIFIKGGMTPQIFLNNPQIQDAIVGHQIEKNLEKYGNIKDAVSIHFSGQPYNVAKNRKDGNGTTVAQYVNKFIKYNNLG